ncbi:hypothetical protein Cni_G16984 [Canna indica]|uniref:Uncharacterized protein n=1 Tax=Canna indica TaxID=4628 RepID=A0AAQ3KGE9_9LILI|nr:hypothetical protein Cni_G16984 [Canna indica]
MMVGTPVGDGECDALSPATKKSSGSPLKSKKPPDLRPSGSLLRSKGSSETNMMIGKEKLLLRPSSSQLEYREEADTTCNEVQFQSKNANPVPVKVNIEKNLDVFHSKLIDTFAIAVNKVKENDVSLKDAMDEDLTICSAPEGCKIRKAHSQNIHYECFPLNIKHTKLKKKEFLKEEGLIDFDGDPSSGKGKGKSKQVSL